MNGVWLKQGETWTRTLKGDAWSVTVGANGNIAATLKDRGVLASMDGFSWRPDATLTQALATMPPGVAQQYPVTLGNLVMDLHTGKAFFGVEWIWIDLIGPPRSCIGRRR